MLGKLIKYEWKSTYKVGLILMFAMAMATLMGFLAFQAPMWRQMGGRSVNDNVGTVMMDMVSMFSFMLYLMILVGAIYAAYIYFVVHFYRTMYTDQGYLLHTLPVGKNEILVSKIFVGSVWMFLVFIGMMVSIVIFGVSMASAISGDGIADVVRAIPHFFSEIAWLFSDMAPFVTWYLVMMILNVILGIPASIIIFYGTVSFGQLFSKHRIIMAIVGYLGLMFIRGLVGAVLQVILSVSTAIISEEEMLGTMYASMFSSLILNLLLAVGGYLISYYVIAKKLNME